MAASRAKIALEEQNANTHDAWRGERARGWRSGPREIAHGAAVVARVNILAGGAPCGGRRAPERAVEMNDPHVVAMIYRVEHDDSVDYEKAARLEGKTDDFKFRVANGRARFELTAHCATEEEARQIVDPFVRAWEIRAAVGLSPGVFRLTFERAEVVDHSPLRDGVVCAVGKASVSSTAVGHAQMVPSKYPDPPTDFSVSDELQVAYEAWRALWPKPNYLAALGNLIMTMLDAKAPPGKGGSQTRRRAEAHYETGSGVLKKLGELTAMAGGYYARKHRGIKHPFSANEHDWLVKAIPALMLRMGEREKNPNGKLPERTVADLLPLP
jgi:hypothetical protein